MAEAVGMQKGEHVEGRQMPRAMLLGAAGLESGGPDDYG
jgi:hypothetical protein